jgi:ethanolamine phosphate transferase 2 subunit G
MSSMASNYDMPKLALGQGLAILAVVLSIAASFLSTTEDSGSFAPFTIITLSYGIMMFASSYVEEEQHFWYWSATAWLAFISLRKLNRYSYLPN